MILMTLHVLSCLWLIWLMLLRAKAMNNNVIFRVKMAMFFFVFATVVYGLSPFIKMTSPSLSSCLFLLGICGWFMVQNDTWRHGIHWSMKRFIDF